MKKTEKVSVVVRSYNRLHFLERAIGSIREQTYKNYEIIAVDDGSSDGSIGFLDSCGDIMLIRQKREGRARALNRGVAAASGEFIAFLDDDDLWKPQYLARVMNLFNTGSPPGAVHADFSYFHENGAGEHYRLVKKLKRDTLESLLNANFISLSAMVVRKESLKCAGGFDDSLNTHEDWDMWLRLALYGVELSSLGENLVRVRRHGDNITENRVEMFSGALHVIEKNLENVPPLYLKTAVSTRKRVSNILGVVMVASGDRKKGLCSLLSGIGKGDLSALGYLILALLPRRAINKLIFWYGEKQVKMER